MVAGEVEKVLVTLRHVDTFDYGLKLHTNVLTVFVFCLSIDLDLKPHATVENVLPTLKVRTIDSLVVFE